ncbi:hypothetical protein [Subtercola frigoramans]|uniref:GNAT superfamily N-acetyltransferase n=1 Tax=Subtercola frigoramans TaxID=120298 RepID=A0ABS2L266_9MICO|nr:hypothetical protein [Subtercola frigoramans]MBM7471157.1 GNAT superfamily N-acetyltransferase [Subtercola frigoramans]
MNAVTVERVRSEKQLREFIAMPLRVQPRDLAVPLLESSIRSWHRGTSPHPEPVELVIARDAGGEVVGRSTLHTDARLDAKLGEKLLLFGATEFRDGEAASALFEYFTAHAASTGTGAVTTSSPPFDALFGPVTLLPNQAGGVITSGFEQRGFIDSAWNEEWVPLVYEAEGFERWGEADTWVVDVAQANAVAPRAAEWAEAGLVLEYGSRRRVSRLIPELLTLLNSSFEQLPYYTPITPAEMAAATDGLAFLLDEKLLLLARDARSSVPVAFVLVIPDITGFVQKVGGRLSGLRQVQLLLTRQKYRTDAVLVIQGTEPTRQGQGILTLLSRQLQANLAEAGYSRLRSTYVARGNFASTAQYTRFGGHPLHGYTFYRKGLR